MKKLLELQDLDLRIHAYRVRETEIPKQKSKCDTRRQRLEEELQGSGARLKALQVEQGSLQTQIETQMVQAKKYEGQLATVKKNEEYQALLHEISAIKRKVDDIEERVIALEYEIEEAKARLAEDKLRIEAEKKAIDAECASIDAELAQAAEDRRALEAERGPLKAECDPVRLSQYERILKKHIGSRAIVPLVNGVCTGCHMSARAQMVNEILEGKVHGCAHCGRLLYDKNAVAATS